ncbi:MAG TPA: hypothetical protein VK470_20185 [Bacteroidota bacterium]|nr:hypothetical protein [Bacteroidota bacterium]
MKCKALLFVALTICSISLKAQTPLQKYAGAESLTTEQYADVVKSVWDELKKASDEYGAQMKSKNEFETSQEFQSRTERDRTTYWSRIAKFNTDEKLSERTFPVLMNVQLLKYDADKQTYSIRSSSSVIVPPTGERVAVTCASNPYVFIRESKRKGYKYAHVVMNTDPVFIWHVNPDIARAAKQAESSVQFKVWFKLDISQPLSNKTSKLTMVPVKIALVNTSNNTVYWTDTISR